MNFFKNAAIVLFPIAIAVELLIVIGGGIVLLVKKVKKHKKSHR